LFSGGTPRSLAGTTNLLNTDGLTLIGLIDSSIDDWEQYESLHWQADAWVKDNPDHAQGPEGELHCSERGVQAGTTLESAEKPCAGRCSSLALSESRYFCVDTTSFEISEEPMSAVAEYARIPISFEVHAVLDVIADASNPTRFTLSEPRAGAPYLKDYDAIDDGSPAQWTQRFDTSKWGLLAARVGGQLIGGAAVAYDTPGLEMLEGRSDLAVLWDIRVMTSQRRHGVGSPLFKAVKAWASARGCRQLKVETQNINMAACRFYARHGCELRAVHRDAYAEFPDEIQLLWYKDLP